MVAFFTLQEKIVIKLFSAAFYFYLFLYRRAQNYRILALLLPKRALNGNTELVFGVGKGRDSGKEVRSGCFFLLTKMLIETSSNNVVIFLSASMKSRSFLLSPLLKCVCRIRERC